jgi:hypothetical protein
MQAPDHDACNARRLSLESDDVADAGFVEPPSVIDDEDFSRMIHAVKGLEKDVDASDVPDGSRSASATHHRRKRPQRWGCASERNVRLQTAIGEVRRREVVELADRCAAQMDPPGA